MSKEKKQSGFSVVWWWLLWIAVTILSFFAAAALWTPVIARYCGNMSQPGVPIIWVTAVFGTWMIVLVPLIIVMYNKVDRAYEDARMRRESAALMHARQNLPFKAFWVDDSERLLAQPLADKLKKIPGTLKNGKLVKAVLRGGKVIENVFVLDNQEVVGIYGLDRLDFALRDIVDLQPMDLDRLPAYEAGRWLRLDLPSADSK